MTVSECVKEWLSLYPNLDISDMATDFIEGDADSYAIYKSPNKTVDRFNDGSCMVTEYYQFFARQSTMMDTERISNQQLLADLEAWVEDKDYNEDYPDLSGVGNLRCEEISISGSAAITSQENDSAIYQVTIAVRYLKEREQ